MNVVTAIGGALWVPAVPRRKAGGNFVPFRWEDALSIDGQLSEDERAIRDAAHGYCQEKLFPACSPPTATKSSIVRS